MSAGHLILVIKLLLIFPLLKNSYTSEKHLESKVLYLIFFHIIFPFFPVCPIVQGIPKQQLQRTFRLMLIMVASKPIGLRLNLLVI